MFEFNNKKKIIIVVSIVSVILIGIISYIIISSFNFRGEESSEDFELEELKENDLNSVEVQGNVANSTSIEEQEGTNLNEENSIKIRESTSLNGNKKIIVHISGEVISPGVISLEEGARIVDQTTPNMIQRLNDIVERKPLISIGIYPFLNFKRFRKGYFFMPKFKKKIE